ncbi:MAG: 30S ribosomal protein S27ae [Thermoprotei archaeon]|nr:MAG: 30S ribosomal protein S27ae [Thermoprotei archaeon]
MAERHKLYEYDYSTGTIKLKNKLCPRCGKVMAKHSDRWACGACGLTIFTRQEGDR